MKRYVLIISILFFFIAGCNTDNVDNEGDEKAELEPVTFVLDWTPNTNHTGIYVAQSEGFFEEEGLDVDIILPGEAGAGQLISTGKADFGISYQERLMMARNEDLPLVSVTAIIQHNTAGYASAAEKNIKNTAEFDGKDFGVNITEMTKSRLDRGML